MKLSTMLCTIATFTIPVLAGSIQITPQTKSAGPNEIFTVVVNADAVDLYAYSFDLSFNPGVLSILAVRPGTLLPGALLFPGTIDNATGRVNGNISSLVGVPLGITGTGSLAEFDFEAIGLGQSPVRLENVVLLDSVGADVPFDQTDATVTVVPEPSTLPMASLLLAAGAWRYRRRGQPPFRTRSEQK